MPPASPPSTESAILICLQSLQREVMHLVAQQMPWLTTAEMCQRYSVTPKTLTAMELRGEIPTRQKGRWNRAELLAWELAP